MASQVCITGIGIVSALGVGVEATWNALQAGRSGIGKPIHLPTEHKDIPVGEVTLSNVDMARMLQVDYPMADLRTVLLGLMAGREAMADAGLLPSDLSNTAFISGTTVGGMDKTERHFKTVSETQAQTSESKELQYNDCGYSTELIAENIGRFRLVTTISTACSSAANAFVLGANLIKAGVVERAVVGGTEALTKFHLNGFNALMILDKEICRPFDRDRSGINLGEGAAYIVFEREETACQRGVNIKGVLSGYANTCDAFHQTASSAEGEGAYLAMTKAMKMAGLQAEDIDYINAHGTGTVNNDAAELAAMTRIWGDTLPRFSSTKAFTGHATSAAGAIEAAICLLALQYNFFPPNLGWKNPIRENEKPITENNEKSIVQHIINNSFGFGGNDTSLIFSKYSKEYE